MSKPGGRAPWLYRFVRDRTGQSETLGLVLILAITIAGTTAVVGLGSSAIGGTQSQSASVRAEHGMTLFDSQVATVALGDSPVRRVRFGGNDGSYSIDPTAGHITVTHVNYDGGSDSDGNIVDEPGENLTTGNDDDHDLYSGDLGSVTYQNDETTIAYQGGGVWRRDGTGNGTMVSPPEFHYRGATLTLPIVRIDGSGGGSGSVTAEVTRNGSTERTFPSEQTYPNGDPYQNPSENGRVVITVESEYASAWGAYFKERTEGTVNFTGPNTVRLTLVSTGVTGGFQMPNEGSGIEIRGLYGGHNLDEYQITIRPDDSDSANFANLDWSMYAENGNRQFEAYLVQGTGSGCSTTADLLVYYSADGGTHYESWYKEDVFTASCSDLNGDGDDEVKLTADLTSSTLLENQEPDNKPLHFSTSGETRITTPTFDQHPGASLAAGGTESYTYADGESEQVGTLMNHYLGLMGPGIELTVDDKNSNGVSESASYGTINYPANDRFVTFIHISENEVVVEFR